MKKTLALLCSLLLVIGLLAACTSGSSNEPAPAEPSTDVKEEPTTGSVGDGRIGQLIGTYFFNFKITEAYLCDDYHGYQPQDGNTLLVVKIDIENLMNSSIPMSDMDFQAQWNDDADDAYAWPITMDPETYEDRGTYCDAQLPYEYELGVGEKRSGELVYEVPEGNKDFSISTYDDFADSEEGDIYFVYFTAGYM